MSNIPKKINYIQKSTDEYENEMERRIKMLRKRKLVIKKNVWKKMSIKFDIYFEDDNTTYFTKHYLDCDKYRDVKDQTQT